MGSASASSGILRTFSKDPFDTSSTGPVWKPPEIQNQVGVQPSPATTPQTVADAMMSGSAFDPYQQSMQEAQTRAEGQSRASTAARIQSSGMAGQGFGDQMATDTENTLMRSRFDNNLNTAVAKQGMVERGATLGLTIQEQNEIARKNAAEEALTRTQIESQSRIAEGQLGLGYATLSSEDAYRNNQTELSREQLALERELGLGELSINQAQQKLQEQVQLGNLSIAQAQQLLNEKLGMGQLALATRTQGLNEKLGMGQLEISRGQLDLANKTQSATEAYQKSLLALENKQLDADTSYKIKQLDLGYKTLANQDKQIMAQINLGTQELTQKDKQFMAQLGLSKDAQDWAEKFQKTQLDLQAQQLGISRAELDARIKQAEDATALTSRQLDLQETDPMRLYQNSVYDQMQQAIKEGNERKASSTNYGSF